MRVLRARYTLFGNSVVASAGGEWPGGRLLRGLLAVRRTISIGHWVLVMRLGFCPNVGEDLGHNSVVRDFGRRRKALTRNALENGSPQ